MGGGGMGALVSGLALNHRSAHTSEKKLPKQRAYIRWVVWVVGMVLRGMLFALIQRVDRLEMLMSKETIPEQGGEAEQSDTRFEEWYNAILKRDIPTPLEKQPDTWKLRISGAYRAQTLQPYTDKSGHVCPIDNICEMITRANAFVGKCVKGYSFKTYEWDQTDVKETLPSGLHVFDAPNASIDAIRAAALADIGRLFNEQLTHRDRRVLRIDPNKPPTNTILFYSRTDKQQSFLEVMGILKEKAPRLAEYVMIYCKIIMNILKTDEGQLQRSNLSLVHYDADAGLNPHIDSLFPFDGTIGPIATIAMGERGNQKYLDMLPTLTHGNPVRVVSYPDEIMVMDGLSRIAWSHGLPWKYDNEQFTIAIKFPAIEREAPIEYDHFKYMDVVAQIPSYVQTAIPRGWAVSRPTRRQ
jgi:hypothetical protein